MYKHKDDYEIEYLPISQIEIDDRLDRKYSTDLKIEDLTKDIENNGLNNELWVNYYKEKFFLIAGFRRLESVKILGYKEVRCKIFKVDSVEAKYMTCSENSNRLNYNIFEKIENFLYLIHLEYVKRNTKINVNFVLSRYASALTQPFNKLIQAERTKEDIKYNNADETIAIDVIRNVFNKSGLYPSYRNAYENISIAGISDKLKRFSIEYQLGIKAIREIEKAEKTLSDNLIEIGKIYRPAKDQITFEKSIKLQEQGIEYTLDEALVQKMENSREELAEESTKIGDYYFHRTLTHIFVEVTEIDIFYKKLYELEKKNLVGIKTVIKCVIKALMGTKENAIVSSINNAATILEDTLKEIKKINIESLNLKHKRKVLKTLTKTAQDMNTIIQKGTQNEKQN